MDSKAKILIGVLVVGIVLVSGWWVWKSSKYYSYGKLKLPLNKKIMIEGVFLSNCTLENWSECINRMGTKGGPGFEICEWNYKVKTFKEVGKYPDCVHIDLLPFWPKYISKDQLKEFKEYLNKKVKATGILRVERIGSKGPNCELSQAGCEREVVIFIPEKIEIVESKPQSPQERYSLEDPELFKEWDVSSLSGKVFFPEVFMMKKLGCPIGAFCLECKEGKQYTMIFNRKGPIIDACLDFQGKECYFGTVSGKVIKESYRPPLPYSKERTIYYLEGNVVKCFEENPAVDIKLKASSEVITNQTFKVEVKVKNNWRVPLKNLKFALERDSQFVLINKDDAGCLSATSSNYQCEIYMNVLYPGEIRTFEFEILPKVWVPSNKYASPQPLPDFFLVSPELPFGSKLFYVTVLRIPKPELGIYPSVPSKVRVGQSFKVKVKIVNEGDAPAKNVSIKMSLPDFATTTDSLSKVAGDLKIDEVKEMEWTIIAFENEDFWINFFAKDEGKKHEWEGTVLVNVVAPEIQIFPTTPIEILLNRDFTVSAVIKNVGELETGNVKVKLKASSEFIPVLTTSLSIENIPPNSQKEIEWKMKGVKAGLGEIEIIANNVSVKRDIVVSNFPLRIETDKNVYSQGENVRVKINITNENFEVSYLNLEINMTIQGENISDSFSKEIPYLQAGKSTEVIFNWNTTEKPEGNYSIIAKLRYKKPIDTITYLNETSTYFKISP